MSTELSGRPPRSLRVDWALAIGGLWVVVGIYCDLAWHVRHDVDSFLTWAHTALYAGLLYTFVATGIIAWRNVRDGYAWTRALPAGYEYTPFGIGLFFIGGAADATGHVLWGFESGFNALLSPTHQLIGFSIILLLIGPIRSALASFDTPAPAAGGDNAAGWPAMLSIGALMALVRWGLDPFFHPYAQARFGPPVSKGFTPDTISLQAMHFALQEHGLASVLFSTIVMAGFALYVARAFGKQSGAMVVIFLIGNGMTSMAVGNDWTQMAAPIAASLLAGFVADRIARPNVMAAVVPIVYNGLVAAVAVVGGTWWDPIFLLGTVIYSGLFGWLLSLIVTARRRSA